MKALMSLEDYLAGWARNGEVRAAAKTVLSLAGAGTEISGLIARGPLAGSMSAVVGRHGDGDSQKELDRITNDLIIEALKGAPVALIASEELEAPLATGADDAPLCVAIDPLDGSSNIDTNVSVGTIFSILPLREDTGREDEAHFFQPGTRQLAAGYIIYGPQTSMVLSVGAGTHIFTLDPADRKYKLTAANLQVPADTREFAINASNYRHWDTGIRQYIDSCLEGAQGARKKNFNTRWIGSMVAECHRILIRGGIYLYPGDAREGYRQGRLRLIYEGNPVAFLMEQAGGAATTGQMRILDVEPTAIHQRIPLIFGSTGEVAIAESHCGLGENSADRSPLFAQRGLFRP